MAIEMKACTQCVIQKELHMFNKRAASSDGLSPICKSCKRKKDIEYIRTESGFINKLYSANKSRNKLKGFGELPYTKDEFINWLYDNTKFNELYSNWKDSGYKTDLIPSVDRLDDYKGYSFNNMRLTTWLDNNHKAYQDRRNGINNKVSKAVIGIHIKTGKQIELHSTGIDECCKGKQKTCGGYKWNWK